VHAGVGELLVDPEACVLVELVELVERAAAAAGAARPRADRAHIYMSI
jgi:hypothetical protein